MYRLESTEFNVVSSSQEQVELSFRSTYNPSRQDSVRLNVDKRWHIHYSDYTSIYFDLFLSSEMVANSHWNLLQKKKTVSSDLCCWKAAPGSTATPSLGTPVTGLPWTFQRLGSLSNLTRTSEYPFFFFRHWWSGIYLNLSQNSLEQADFLPTTNVS